MKALILLGLGAIAWLGHPALAAANMTTGALTNTNYQTAIPIRIAPSPAPRVQNLSALANRLAANSNAVGRVAVSPQIKAVPGGGRADFGLLKVLFPADVNGTRPVTVTAPDGGALAFRARWLAWYDTSTGQRWALAQITNRLGVIRGKEEVVYTNCFDSLRADLRYRYSPRGHRLEQDVILRQRPALPTGLLAENARLEIWTEWFDSVPTARQAQTLDLRKGSGLTNGPALVADEGLTFGTMRVGAGHAFSTGTPGERIAVAKAWLRVNQCDWLVETVDYPALKTKLDALSTSGSARVTKPASSSEALIASLAAGTSRGDAHSLAQLSTFNAHSSPEAGVVLDFAILSCVPVPPDAVSWWPAGGNASDVIGGHDGTLQNSATYGPGQVGQGFSFPPWDDETQTGGDGYVRVPDHAALHFTNVLTIEAWIYPEDVDWYHEIVSTWDAVWGQNQKSYTTGLGPGGQFRFIVNPSGQNGQDVGVVSSNAVTPGEWTHVAATYDGSTLRVYLNGALDGEGVYTNGIFAGTNEVGIGACIGGAQNGELVSPFIGQIDEPALYRRALSAAEIQALYDAGTAGKINPNCLAPPADLAAWFPGDAHGYDIAGTNVATLHNGASYSAAVASHGFHFDGDNDNVTAPDDPALNFAAGQDFTLELWFNAPPTETQYNYGVQTLLGKRQIASGDTVMGWELFLIDGVPGLQIDDAPLRSWNWVTYIADTPDLRDGGWHHLAVTVDRDDEAGGHFYVDGSEVLEFDPTVMPGALTNALPLLIGVHPDSGLHCNFGGVLDEISVYHRALSGTEISQLYEAGGAGKCKVDTDNDGMQDWWEMKHFGTLDRDGTGDYDGDGVSDAQEYNGGVNSTDPNKIKALLQFTNLWVATTSPAGTVELLGGVPAQMALQADNTNFTSATWGNYCSNFTVNLGTTDGFYTVWVGLRGWAADSQQTWLNARLMLDRTAPLLVLTNPASATGSVPLIQVKGYSPEPIESLWLTLSNAAGVNTNIQGFVKDQDYDTNLFTFTTNYFQAFDLILTNGDNAVTLRAVDLAGNVTVLTTNYTLQTDSNAPVVSVIWPQEGMQLCGTNFTLQGYMDDPTALIALSIANTNGVTNVVAGLVERYGRFWVENVPLDAGTNWLTLTAVDVWGNPTSTNLYVIKSDVALEVTSIPTNDLHNLTVTIGGTLTNADYTVWVNGVQATISSGTWQADNVPVSEGPTAVFAVTAYPPGENPEPDTNNPTLNLPSANAVQARPEEDKPMRVWIANDYQKWFDYYESWWTDNGVKETRTHDQTYYHNWNDNKQSGGAWCDRQSYGNTVCRKVYTWPASIWPSLASGTAVGENDCAGTSTIPPPEIAGEHCGITDSWRCEDGSSGDKDFYVRLADTKIKLFTGSKPIPGYPSIFVLQGYAAEILFPRAKPPYTGLSSQDQRPIPFEQIVLGAAGPLGNDGFTYKRFGVGEIVDITPRVKGKRFYSFSADADPHQLVHKTYALALVNRDSNRTKLGVGEQVQFTFYPPLGMHDPEHHEWTTTAGSVVMNGPPEWGLHGSYALFTAPSNANPSVMVKVEVRNAVIETPFQVVEPQDYDTAHTRITYTGHYPNSLGKVAAFMRLNVVIAPTDVSFYRVDLRERKGPATGITGYFTHFDTNDLAHSTADVFVRLQEDNELPYGGACYFQPPQRFPWTSGNPESGEYHYDPIPAEWKIEDGETNSLANWSAQHFNLDSNGTLTISKFGTNVQRTLDDQVTPDIQ